ncbi:MmcQ/YjbR family DNA-binding protein [Amycolatopsis sp. DSM 110486]|uniref:MmcQ/YjbR family DNA-binding protein n=1 Tax=Amycolatopsis sp. DSM 110486 TaxID=2865832 RepID=UPI001C699CBC|nr:MmcQ/YjbR family DNA-binding protein [Amycolatopsis sp. DSM 110486]QYN16488.1 MmcQ/YjbR family DNA-binding protein [Amycolatopsis sp. DSM 110486]
MSTWDDVARLGAQLPGTELVVKRDTRSWGVKGKAYAWERPLRKTDLDALGDAAPAGDVLAVRVPDVGAKEALLADEPGVFFTTPHFNGYPAVLVRLTEIDLPTLEEALVEGWLCRVPKKVGKQYLEERGTG